jgi:ribosomal protein S18 acetylase RimI-like enzyme
MTADDLVRVADESFIASFRKLAQHAPEGETHEAGSIFSFVTGLPLSGFNGCVATQEASADDLAVSLAWVAARDVPFRVWVAEKLAARLAEVPSGYALEPAASLYPGMVLNPIPDPLALSPGVSVVTIEPSLKEFIGVLEESGLRPDLAHRLITPSFAADPDVQLFVGRLDGKPVGTSIAIRSRGASGIYNVGTLPEARRRGVGSAVTWAAIEAGRAWGYDTIVLQSSVMGLSMYSAMGFRTVAPYVVFADRPSASAPLASTHTSGGVSTQ